MTIMYVQGNRSNKRPILIKPLHVRNRGASWLAMVASVDWTLPLRRTESAKQSSKLAHRGKVTNGKTIPPQKTPLKVPDSALVDDRHIARATPLRLVVYEEGDPCPDPLLLPFLVCELDELVPGSEPVLRTHQPIVPNLFLTRKERVITLRVSFRKVSPRLHPQERTTSAISASLQRQ